MPSVEQSINDLTNISKLEQAENHPSLENGRIKNKLKQSETLNNESKEYMG